MIENVYVRSGSDFDLSQENSRAYLEKWIQDFSITVLIIDTIGDAWVGDENAKKDVTVLTKYFDSLIKKYHVSIILIHHWRKKTRDSRSGGEMASGSYKWSAWVDNHITLDGKSVSHVNLSCEKSRNSPKFPPLIIGIDDETLRFKFKGQFDHKFDDSTLFNIYESFNQEWVTVPAMVKKAQELKVCSGDTVRKLIHETKIFEVDASGHTHRIRKKEENAILWDES